MNARLAAAVVLIGAALLLSSTASAGPEAPRQRVAITAKNGDDAFVLTPLTPGAIQRDSGTVDFCCLTERIRVRNGQRVEINDPQVTFTGKRGTLVVRHRIEWMDAGNGYTIGPSTWKVVRGTGGYAGITGSGGGASSWPLHGPASFRNEGFLESR